MKTLAAIAMPGEAMCGRGVARPVLLVMIWLVATHGALAQSTIDETAQYQRIAIEREQAEAEFEQRQWQCSKRFIVTSCVNAARVQRRNALDVLNREEAAIDSARRQARADRRLAIIKQKTEAFAKLRPLVDEPLAASQAIAAEPAPVKARKAAAPIRDSAAADDAAAKRAQASELRRAEARERQLERESRKSSQKSPASSLPARPPIPPAEAASAPSR